MKYIASDQGTESRGDKCPAFWEIHYYQVAYEARYHPVKVKYAVLDSPFFQDLTPEQYDLLSPLFEPFTVQPKTVIFKQGDEAGYLYVISVGRVAIKYKPYDGPKITLTHLGAGGIFGWSSVVGGETYTSDAVSTAQVEGYRIRGVDLIRLCVKFPSIGGGILEKLAVAVSPRWANSRKQIQELLQPALPRDS